MISLDSHEKTPDDLEIAATMAHLPKGPIPDLPTTPRDAIRLDDLKLERQKELGGVRLYAPTGEEAPRRMPRRRFHTRIAIGQWPAWYHGDVGPRCRPPAVGHQPWAGRASPSVFSVVLRPSSVRIKKATVRTIARHVPAQHNAASRGLSRTARAFAIYF
jgi:hypothetical protein